MMEPWSVEEEPAQIPSVTQKGSKVKHHGKKNHQHHAATVVYNNESEHPHKLLYPQPSRNTNSKLMLHSQPNVESDGSKVVADSTQAAVGAYSKTPRYKDLKVFLFYYETSTGQYYCVEKIFHFLNY